MAYLNSLSNSLSENVNFHKDSAKKKRQKKKGYAVCSFGALLTCFAHSRIGKSTIWSASQCKMSRYR